MLAFLSGLVAKTHTQALEHKEEESPPPPPPKVRGFPPCLLQDKADYPKGKGS